MIKKKILVGIEFAVEYETEKALKKFKNDLKQTLCVGYGGGDGQGGIFRIQPTGKIKLPVLEWIRVTDKRKPKFDEQYFVWWHGFALYATLECHDKYRKKKDWQRFAYWSNSEGEIAFYNKEIVTHYATIVEP